MRFCNTRGRLIPMIVDRHPYLPPGWRFGVIIQEGDLTVHGWLLYGYVDDPRRSARIEELVHAGSIVELQAQALRRIAQATGAAHT